MSHLPKSNADEIEVEEQLSNLERFIARRFDEISMEINATSQMIDMAEEGASRRFHEMLGMLHAITHSGDGNTPANSGAELETVIGQSEKAVTRIMDASEKINTCLADNPNAKVSDIAAQLEAETHEILMACSFQDLTGQRIRTALENIRMIEERLSSTLSKFGIKTDDPKQKQKNSADDFIPDSAASQGDIDALFD